MAVLLTSRAIETIINWLMRPNVHKCQSITDKRFYEETAERQKILILTFFFGLSTFANMLGGNLDPEVVQPQMYKLSLKWACHGINDHAILGLIDDPLGRKPKYVTL